MENSIPIHERVELPESWIPADSRVEIDAKITAGTDPFLLLRRAEKDGRADDRNKISQATSPRAIE